MFRFSGRMLKMPPLVQEIGGKRGGLTAGRNWSQVLLGVALLRERFEQQPCKLQGVWTEAVTGALRAGALARSGASAVRRNGINWRENMRAFYYVRELRQLEKEGERP